MAVANGIGIVCLVTHVCLASAILSAARVSPDTIGIPPRSWHNYPWTTGMPARHPNHRYDDHAAGGDPRKPTSTENLRPMRLPSSLLDARKQRSQQTGPQRFPLENLPEDGFWLSAKVSNASPPPPPTTTTMTTTGSTTTALSGARNARGYQRYVPRYRDTKVSDGVYGLDRPEAAKSSSYRVRDDSTAYYHPQDVTAAIRALDRFLSRTLNNDGYNSELHPPPNPVLALVLSRYGRYVPGTQSPRVYAHTAVNNVHNNQPFGKYKYECDEEAIYAVR